MCIKSTCWGKDNGLGLNHLKHGFPNFVRVHGSFHEYNSHGPDLLKWWVSIQEQDVKPDSRVFGQQSVILAVIWDCDEAAMLVLLKNRLSGST